MSRGKLPYDFDDFDMGLSMAQPALTLQIRTPSDHFYGSHGRYKAPTLFHNKKLRLGKKSTFSAFQYPTNIHPHD